MKAFTANGTIRVGRFVKIDPADNNSILECDANERTIGISQMGGRAAPIPDVSADPPEAAQAGEQCNVHLNGEDCLLYLGTGGVTAGGLLKADADGKGVPLAETAALKEECGAIAMETALVSTYCKVVVRVGTVTTPA